METDEYEADVVDFQIPLKWATWTSDYVIGKSNKPATTTLRKNSSGSSWRYSKNISLSDLANAARKSVQIASGGGGSFIGNTRNTEEEEAVTTMRTAFLAVFVSLFKVLLYDYIWLCCK